MGEQPRIRADELRAVIEERRATDEILPDLLPVAALAAYAVYMILRAEPLLELLLSRRVPPHPPPPPREPLVGTRLLLLVASLTLISLLTYKMIERLSRHAERSSRLLYGVAALLESEGRTAEALEARRAGDELRLRAAGRSATLWALLVIASVVLLGLLSLLVVAYVLYMLCNELGVHIELERRGFDALRRAHPDAPAFEARAARYDALVYAAASVLTLGVFAVYWGYRVNLDYNSHMVDHDAFESRLLAWLESQGA